jgi:hypothetical protein
LSNDAFFGEKMLNVDAGIEYKDVTQLVCDLLNKDVDGPLRDASHPLANYNFVEPLCLYVRYAKKGTKPALHTSVCPLQEEDVFKTFQGVSYVGTNSGQLVFDVVVAVPKPPKEQRGCANTNSKCATLPTFQVTVWNPLQFDTNKGKLTATPDTPLETKNCFEVEQGCRLGTLLRLMTSADTANSKNVIASKSAVYTKKRSHFQKIPSSEDLWCTPLCNIWTVNKQQLYTIKLAMQQAPEEESSGGECSDSTPTEIISPMKCSSRRTNASASKSSKNTDAL